MNMTMKMAVSRSTTTITRRETAELELGSELKLSLGEHRKMVTMMPLRQGRRSAGYALVGLAAAAAPIVGATTSPRDARQAMS
jgi:hypothetical protein